MKVLISNSAEVTKDTLKRKLKVGTILQMIVAVPPSISSAEKDKKTINVAYTYVVTDIEYAKSGEIKKCTMSSKSGPKPSPITGLKSVEVFTAAALIKMFSTKVTKEAKVGTKSLKFVTSAVKTGEENKKLEERLAAVVAQIKSLQREEKSLRKVLNR